MSFDLDDALTRMVVYYENYMGNPILPIDRYSVNDPIIMRHLKKEISFDATETLSSVTISDFPNEKGVFMLWELTVTEDAQDKRFVPVFINEDGILRPLAGKKIWEALLDAGKQISVLSADRLDSQRWEALYTAAQEFAYDTFLSLKEEADQRRRESYRKYMYALELRTEAAKKIGIENIRRHRLIQLMKEKSIMSRNYEASQKLCPEFRPVMVLRME